MSQSELESVNQNVALARALAVAAKLFLWAGGNVAAQDFQSACACACGATFMTYVAHLGFLPYLNVLRLFVFKISQFKINNFRLAAVLPF